MAAALNLRNALYAEFEALPDPVTGEVIAGELMASPRPELDHAEALSEGVSQLRRGLAACAAVVPGSLTRH